MFFSSIIWISCQSDAKCDQPPCPRPDINQIIELNLLFPDAQIGDSIGLVRVNRSDKTAVDTTQFELTAEKVITIGRDGVIGFSVITSGDIIEEATLDYKVLVSNEQINDISDIEIERFLTQDECGCADYQIASLTIDGLMLEVNANNFTLHL